MDAYNVFSLTDIEKEAREIVEAARAQAKQILQEAQTAAGRVRDQARQEGLQAGRAQAREEGIQLTVREATEVRGLLEQAVATIRQKKDELMRDAEKNLTRLAAAIAEKILKREIRIDPETVLGPLRAALEACIQKGELLIMVHPEDADVAGKYMIAMGRTMPADVTVQVVGDPAIGRGGCSVRYRTGTVEADLQEQLGRIEKILNGETP